MKIQDIFTRPNDFLPDMSGGQQSFMKTVVMQKLLKFNWHYMYFCNVKHYITIT